MEWPLINAPLTARDIPPLNAYYLDLDDNACDSTMLWGDRGRNDAARAVR
jgi:hypothetical protein